jgi:hypothetical protein
VKKWRGTRESFNLLKKENLLDYWTRYSVKEVNGLWTEYYGANQISSPSGQLLPVLDIVSTLPSNLNPGDRYLVGQDSTDTQSSEYYIVTIDIDKTQSNGLSYHYESFTNNSGISVRVINKKSMSYQLVNGKICTYDIIDGGCYDS